MRKDTCCLMAVSLGMTYQPNQALPVIWSVDHLPFDCYKLLSVPDPIGGCLVFATNQLLYFNQNVTYNLVLNDYAYMMSDAHQRFTTGRRNSFCTKFC
jgi:cleavage and polyadenylation specificity factor subunit 1